MLSITFLLEYWQCYISTLAWLFSEIKLLKFFLQLDIVVSYWYAEFEVFWCKNWVVWSFQSLGRLVLAVVRWLFRLNFFGFIPLSFYTKILQNREITSWLLYLPVKKISATFFLKKNHANQLFKLPRARHLTFIKTLGHKNKVLLQKGTFCCMLLLEGFCFLYLRWRRHALHWFL